jgi:hypothetical protein
MKRRTNWMLLSAFYYTYDLPNILSGTSMPIIRSSRLYRTDQHMEVCFLGLDDGKVWVGWLCGWADSYCTVAASPAAQPANPHLTTIKTKEAAVPCGEEWYIIVSS